MKNVFQFMKDWAEITVVLPATLTLVLFGNILIHLIDPVASWIDAGTLSILIFNLVCLSLTFGFSYLVYKINFGDWFKDDWAEKLTPLQGAVINLILWISTVGISAFVLLRNI